MHLDVSPAQLVRFGRGADVVPYMRGTKCDRDGAVEG